MPIHLYNNNNVSMLFSRDQVHEDGHNYSIDIDSWHVVQLSYQGGIQKRKSTVMIMHYNLHARQFNCD